MTAPTDTSGSRRLSGAPRPSSHAAGGDTGSGRSIGELISKVTADLSSLLRQEIALAKLELKKDAVAAGKGAGMLGAAGALALFAAIFLSIALAYALGRIFNLGSGFLMVGLLYLLIAAVLGFIGYKNLKKVSAPTKTIETVKDDIAWAKHPTVAPPRKSR